MANKTKRYTYLILFLVLFFFSFSFAKADVDLNSQEETFEDVENEKSADEISKESALKDAILDGDFDKIYNSIDEADFEYLFGIDPYQPDDYTKYMYSPYPLFRSGVTLIFKSKTIPAGYYLLTPREKNGKTYILFKENGRISFCIPAYKVQNVTDEYYEEHFPQLKLNASQKASKGFMDFIGTKWGKRNKRTPIPKAYIEFNDANMYWDMILYYGDKKYYLIFKKG